MAFVKKNSVTELSVAAMWTTIAASTQASATAAASVATTAIAFAVFALLALPPDTEAPPFVVGWPVAR